ncbi:hypothetical protein LCGC14_0855030 [marine sediment metagenome]|uniref:Uncharacterized protein n=1 Tax=marine sediment metagenome TaxID=412755 RepID=A0A0F9PUF6_9ZZZZ
MNFTIESKSQNRLLNAVDNFNTWLGKIFPDDKIFSLNEMRELRSYAKTQEMTIHEYYRRFRKTIRSKRVRWA